MVPNCEEPLFSWIFDYISEKRITFAASNFEPPSELTLQIVGGVIKQDTNGNNKNRNAYDRKRLLVAGCCNMLSNWHCNYSLLRRKKIVWTSDVLVPNTEEPIYFKKA